VFRRANASTFFFGAAFISVTVFLPLFLVNVAGVSATGAGMALIPFSFGIVFSATLSGQLVNRVGYRPQILVGATIFFLSALLLAGMDSSTRYAEVTAFMVLAGLGVGPSLPLFTLAVQNAVDVRVIGQATSASQFFRQTGATIGAAFMGTILATTLGMSFAQLELPVEVLGPGVTAEDFLSTGGAGLPDRIREGFATMAAGEGREALLAEGERVAADIDRQLKEAFSAATRRIYGVTALLIAFAALLAWRIPELPLRTTHDREEVGS
jgi:MFS family permease